jgi:hypothetical protein
MLCEDRHQQVRLTLIARLLLAAVLVLLVVCRQSNGSSQGFEHDDVIERDGFLFSPGTCELGTEFCAVATPRPWARTEIELVGVGFDQILASDLGRRIIEQARRNGFRTLRRFTEAARLNALGGYEAQPMLAAVTHTDDRHSLRTIDVTDRFFGPGSARDHFSGEPGYLLTTEILAHELVHAMDFGQQYSGTAEFRKVARLGTTAALQQEADRVNLERERLTNAERYESAWEVSRSFAVFRLRGRLPSVLALNGYREAFAEFGAHLVLDPNARRRFEPRLIRYFDRVAADAR